MDLPAILILPSTRFIPCSKAKSDANHSTHQINKALSFICPHIITAIKHSVYIPSEFTTAIHIHDHVLIMQSDRPHISKGAKRENI